MFRRREGFRSFFFKRKERTLGQRPGQVVFLLFVFLFAFRLAADPVEEQLVVVRVGDDAEKSRQGLDGGLWLSHEPLVRHVELLLARDLADDGLDVVN